MLADESPNQYTDTIALFNYGFGNFERINVSQTETRFQIDNAGFFYSSHDIFGSSKPILSLNTQDYIILPKSAAFTDAISSISYGTGEEHSAALISYTYHDWFVGSVSVDFADRQQNPYHFESVPSDALKGSGEQKIIFVNIFKVLLGIIGIAGAVILIILIRAFLKSYQFSARDHSGRRRWLRARRKKKRNRYQKLHARRLEDLEEERELEEMRRKRRERKAKRAKRSRRFWYYDY